jgi:hypothetical protein
MEGQNGANGGARFTPAEPFQRDFDGSDDDEGDDFMPQRPFRERAPADRVQNYNQHQQPQPYIAEPAFPQAQPHGQQQNAAPATNGASSQNGEAQGTPLPEGDRGPRRRRRRPLGEQTKSYNGRNGSTHPAAAGLNGSAPVNEAAPDEAAS